MPGDFLCRLACSRCAALLLLPRMGKRITVTRVCRTVIQQVCCCLFNYSQICAGRGLVASEFTACILESAIASNLALVFVINGLRVPSIDLHIRPQLHKYAGWTILRLGQDMHVGLNGPTINVCIA